MNHSVPVAIKGVVPNGGYAIGNRDAREAVAPGERIVSNAGNRQAVDGGRDGNCTDISRVRQARDGDGVAVGRPSEIAKRLGCCGRWR